MKCELGSFRNGDCELFNNSPMIFIGIYNLSSGKPCMGCAWESGCECKKNLNKSSSKPKELKPTNAELGVRLGISGRQVSKLRKAGTLDDILSRSVCELL